VWSKRERKRIRKTFDTFATAQAWRQDAQVALRKGTLRAPTPETVKQAADAWLEGARSGQIRNRSGDTYKPATIRAYECALKLRLLPHFGSYRLSDVRRTDAQDFADGLLTKGLDPSTIANTLMPLRAIYRRHLARGDVGLNPVSGIELPAVRGKRDRIVAPAEAAKLIAAAPSEDRALWATAFYGGLRLGELRALGWSNVDLAAGLIRVERSWDDREGFIDPKSRAGRRKVPIPAALRDHLTEHRMNGDGHGFVFGDERPFNAAMVYKRAREAWKKAKISPVTLHEARHCFASLMIAAGVNAKALATFMGHATISLTLDRYGHLFPGSEDEAAELLDAFLEGANTAARLAQVSA
jgi:integrase